MATEDVTDPQQETLDQWTLTCLENELGNARAKFPMNTHLLHALMEEVGELAKAYLQREDIASIRLEAVQVATIAIRIFEEGDADFDNVTDEEAKP